VNVAFEVVQTCLPHLLASSEGQERMRQMIPTFDQDLKAPGNAGLFEKTSREAAEQLQLHLQPTKQSVDNAPP
jgi:malate dehydrogenase (quinone)